MDEPEAAHPGASPAAPVSAPAPAPDADPLPRPPGEHAGSLSFVDLGAFAWMKTPAWVYDAGQFRHWWANEAGLRFWRAADLEELCARSYADTSEATRARLALSMQAHARGETTHERWTLYPQGRPVSILLQGTGIRLPDGRTGILFLADAGAPIEPAVMRGVEALHHAPVLIGVHHLPDGGVLMRNPAAELAFGAATEPGAHPFAGMFRDTAEGQDIFDRACRSEGVEVRAELLTARGPVWHVVGARRALDPASGDAVLVFHGIDVSELMATQRALECARERAQAANRAKSAFLGLMSHELRTPLHGMVGTLSLLERTSLDERQQRWLQLALTCCQGLSTLVSDLLELVAIESGDKVPAQDAFPLAEALETALRPLAPEAHRKDLQFRWDVAPDVPAHIVGDVRLVRRVVFNLASNALAFTVAGSVRVRAAMCDVEDGRRCVRIEVVDTGMGIPADRQELIFRPFVQLDRSLAGERGGTGLGLALVRRIVERLGGFMELKSAPGLGSTFAVVLPVG